MKYPKYLVLITCTLLLGSYFLQDYMIKAKPPLGKNQTFTFFESELLKNYNDDDLSQAKGTIYITQYISLSDINQNDLLEITFDYDTTSKKLKDSKKNISLQHIQGMPIALTTIFQGNQSITNFYLKSQLRSKKKFIIPLNSHLGKSIRLEVQLMGTAPLSLYSLSFTRNSPKNYPN